ncbi:MAG: VIT domain-containing protein [Pseudomonadota bacterium]
MALSRSTCVLRALFSVIALTFLLGEPAMARPPLRVARHDEEAYPMGGVVQRLRGSLQTPRAVKADRGSAPFLKVVSGDDSLEQLPLKSTRADVDVAGVIAQVKLTQVFRNEGRHTIEAEYVFPASTRAAVYAMKMTIGSRVIEAQIQKRDEARETYEQALQEGRTASLLEQQRPNVFQMSVGNILAGDEIQVELFYTELLQAEDRVYELVIPTVVGPRYVNGTEPDTRGPRSWTANPHLQEGEAAPYTFGATVDLRGAMPIARVQCSHDVDVVYSGKESASVVLQPDAAHGNRDLILRYTLAGAQVQSGLLLYPGDDENFFTLMVEPPARVSPETIVPREYLFILDVSGSMQGFPLEVSKALMQELLEQLGPQDFFNVLFFAGDSALLSERSLPVSRNSIRRARSLVGMQHGGGGTELVPALERALALPRVAGAERIVVVATDGFVGVERRAFQLIRDKLGEANFFAFGIGSSVNRFLIEGMARAGQGEPFVATTEAEAKAQARRLGEYIRAPLLRDITVRFEGFGAYDVAPSHFPTLFADRPLVIHGKYKGPASGRVLVRGSNASGAFEASLDVADADRSEENAALRHLWARKKVQLLADDRQLEPTDEDVAAITQLGLRYNLLTEFTSFVAVDTVVRGDGTRGVTVRQPLPLPAGVSNSAVGGAGKSGSSYGFGGLGVQGTGHGGGGSAMGSIGVGSVGTRGRGGGSVGYGSGAGGLGGRVARVPRVMAGQVVVQGSLDKEVIRRVIQDKLAQVKACYQRELAREPELAGRVVLEFVVGEDGKVQSARVVETTLNSAAVEICLTKKATAWRFPAVKGGGTVIVRYPFMFKPPA